MAAKSVTQDMTQGKPVSLLLKFFFPLLFGMLFQQFYNVVDMAIVGKTLGSENLAAVGAYRIGQFSDPWFLYGCVQRICHTGGAEVWCKRL